MVPNTIKGVLFVTHSEKSHFNHNSIPPKYLKYFLFFSFLFIYYSLTSVKSFQDMSALVGSVTHAYVTKGRGVTTQKCAVFQVFVKTFQMQAVQGKRGLGAGSVLSVRDQAQT